MASLVGLLPVDAEGFDVVPGKAQSDLGAEVAHFLGMKGFCVVGLNDVPGFEPNLVDEAVEEARILDAAGKLERPARELVEGLLGEAGTGEMLLLPEPSANGNLLPPVDGQRALQALDSSLAEFSVAASERFPSLGFDCYLRSCAALHRCGLSLHDTPQLSDEDCVSWLGLFARQRVMMILFMGPGRGTLELQLFDEEAAVQQVKLESGSLVILRSDLLSHRLSVSSESFTLCCWCLAGDDGDLSDYVPDMVPVARSLHDWSMARMQQLHSQKSKGELACEVPRPWRLAMSHMFASNHPVAIRGDAYKGHPQNDPETFWKVLLSGADLIREVPVLRWDHSQYYDPEPSDHYISKKEWKVSVKHGCFMEGMELFDNKFFGISPGEASGMDPMQRHILETSYTALHKAGYTKKSLMGNYIAVFTGCTNPEFMYIDKPIGALSGAGASQAITSNRTSFALGIMGPSSSVDCDMASAAMALQLGATAVAPSNSHRTLAEGNSEAAVCGGVYVMVTPFMWLRYQNFMNPVGRCFTFDQSSGGYVRGECCASVCLKPYFEVIDGDKKKIQDEPCLGSLVGFRMTSSGHAASLTAPSGPAQQEAVIEALHHAEIDCLDLDAVECHGATGLLADAVEASSLAKILRGGQHGDEECLLLSTVRSNTGAHMEACGIASLIKVLYSQLQSTHVFGLHLNLLNPHIQFGDGAVQITDSCVPFRQKSSFNGVHSLGIGGANCHLITWSEPVVERGRRRPQRSKEALAERKEKAISFWPAGGGLLEADARPRQGYYIVGSWSQWEKPEEMFNNRDGTYSSRITLGMSSYESFEIWMDANPCLKLHPEQPFGSSGSRVHGPSKQSRRRVWTIDGRPSASEDGELAAPSRDAGRPGDCFSVTLHVAGKWRMVSWEKERLPESPVAPVPTGSYYISGPVNCWALRQMAPTGEPGVFSAEVGPLLWPSGEFQIVCNKDFDQAFYPEESDYPRPTSDGWQQVDVGPPRSSGQGTPTWHLLGREGDVFKVVFRRDRLAGGEQDGPDTGLVSWRKVRRQELSKEQRDAAARRGFCLAGTWDLFQRPLALRWDGDYLTCPVALGSSGEESFVLLQEGRWDSRFVPVEHRAGPNSNAGIKGPIRGGLGNVWTIGGTSAEDQGGTEEGAEFGVRLRLAQDGRPSAVEWGRGIAFGTLGGGIVASDLGGELVAALGMGTDMDGCFF